MILATIPLFLSSVLFFSPEVKINKASGIILLLLWLVFFPNAPYMITDLFQITNSNTIPIWYDAIILFSAAIYGLMLAMVSLFDVEMKLKELNKPNLSRLFIFLALILGSFGIYLGRFIQWNSWDVFNKPFKLYNGILQIMASPFENSSIYLMTIFVFFSLNMYLYFV